MSSFISLHEAAILSGYHQDYLSFLIRKNKLNGRKIGRSWCVKKNDIRNFMLDKNNTKNQKHFGTTKKSKFEIFKHGFSKTKFFVFSLFAENSSQTTTKN